MVPHDCSILPLATELASAYPLLLCLEALEGLAIGGEKVPHPEIAQEIVHGLH